MVETQETDEKMEEEEEEEEEEDEDEVTYISGRWVLMMKSGLLFL